MKDVRLSDAITRFLDWARTNNAPATVAVYALYLKRFLAGVGDVWLSTITPAMVTKWSTKYHPVASVRRLTSWCHRSDRTIEADPLAGMPKMKRGRRRRVFSRLEASRLIRRADRRFRLVAIALRESIARPQEIRAVRFVDLLQMGGEPWTPPELLAGRCFFALEEAKGFDQRKDDDALRIIPVSPRLGRLLWRVWLRGVDPARPIFANRNRRPWTKDAIRCQMRKLRELVGLVADRRGEHVVAYTFRHTGATRAVIAGIRGRMLADWMGHSEERMQRRYVHLSPADLIDAAKTVWEAKTPSSGKNDRLGLRRTRPDDQR